MMGCGVVGIACMPLSVDEDDNADIFTTDFTDISPIIRQQICPIILYFLEPPRTATETTTTTSRTQ
jgi:hypothetical protein